MILLDLLGGSITLDAADLTRREYGFIQIEERIDPWSRSIKHIKKGG